MAKRSDIPPVPADHAHSPRPALAAGMGQCSLDVLFTVDTFPPPDSKVPFLECAVQGGGPAATALVVLARWGIAVRFAGVVCCDPAGSKILEGLQGERIDVSATVRRKAGSSQQAFICVERSTGRRNIFWRGPEAAALEPSEIPDSFLQGPRVLHLDGSFPDAALALARKARLAGVPVSLDAGSMKPGITALIRHTDHLIASEAFARQMAPDHPPQRLLQRLKEMGPARVTITLGERGSVSLWNDMPVLLPALPVRAKDTTGAGDVFHGAYLYGLLQGWTPEQCLRWSTVAAALSCASLGGRAGIPPLETVRENLDGLPPFEEAVP